MPDEISQLVGIVRSAVCRHLDEAGVDRPQRRGTRQLSSQDRTQQADLARELEADGWPVERIAAKLDVSKTQVYLYLRPRALGEEGQLVIRCEFCGDPIDRRSYAPRDPGFGPARFCSYQCAGAYARDGYQRVLDEAGLVGIPQVAGRWRISIGRVHNLLADGLLNGERVTYPGQIRPGWGIREGELERFERYWVRGEGSEHPSRRRWLNPDMAVEQLRSLGHIERKARRLDLTLSEVEGAERVRYAERARLFNRRRAGRKPSAGPPAYHLQWLDRLNELEGEIDPDDRPSCWELCAVVAQEDWQKNEDNRWPRSVWPASKNDDESLARNHRKGATERVSKAVKRLQIRQTEISQV